MIIAECCLKLNKPDDAMKILDKYETEHGEEKSYLLLKLLTLSKLKEKDKNNNELKNTIIEICDKIQSCFGDNAMVDEVKQLYLNE